MLDTLMYVIDRNHKILYRNDAFKKHYPNVPCGVYCYEALGHVGAVCRTCPVNIGGEGVAFHREEKDEWLSAQVAEIEWQGEPGCFVVVARVRENKNAPVSQKEREVFRRVITDLRSENDQMSLDMKDAKEQLKTQNELLESQEQLLNYIDEAMPGGYHLCSVEPGHQFIHISSQMLQMLGFTREEIKTRFENSVEQLVYFADKAQFGPLLNAPHPKVGKTVEFRYRMYANNENGYIWVKDVAQVCERHGKLFYQGIILDITDEMEAQASLRKRNKEMELILSTIPGGVMVANMDENYTYQFLSREAAALFGYTTEELLKASGGSSLFIIHPDDREEALKKVGEELKNGSYSIRYRACCKDGSQKYVMEYGRMNAGEDGTPCLVAFYLDVTKEEKNRNLIQLQKELLAREAELKAQREENMRRQSLIQALSEDFNNVYYVDIDRDSYEIYRIGGYVTKELKTAIINENKYSEIFSYYVKTQVYEPDQEEMLRLFSLDSLKRELDRHHTFVLNYRRLRDGDGGLLYFRAKCVRVEGEGYKAVIGFQNVDGEIRKEIDQKQKLSEALSQAEYANIAKTTFLNNMSHDIRTPMNAIIGFTNLAMNHLDNREQVEDYLQKIANSSSHLLSLINDVLDMSRIESGKMCLDEKPENLADIMKNIRNMIQSDIHARQLQLFIDTVDVTDEDVYCDKLRLNQVLLNLVSNAMKFTKPGGSVFISIRQIGKKPGDRAASYEFHVRDTGIGMSKEFAEHIFEPFTRENTSTVSGIQGTGLGMSIAKSIVDMMGGTITVNTEAGKGTEFCVALRFRLQSAHRTIEKIKELEGQRVLVIDDDLNSCQSVAGMLHQLGLEAEWTVYGEDGVDRTKKAVEAGNPYRIYIVDWKMADMNGIETARQIRQIVGKDAPIIMLSAYDWADIEAQAQDVGVTCFVRKPLFISELYHVLMKACGYLEETEPEEEGGKEEIFKGKRVLLAEDNVLNTEIAVELLTETGLEVETAENGKVACEMLAASRPGYYDLILMDIQMPIMDGYEATRQIRSLKDPVLSRIPIIAMTANAFEEDRKKAESCGVNGYVAKPIEVDKLFDAIGKIVL